MPSPNTPLAREICTKATRVPSHKRTISHRAPSSASSSSNSKSPLLRRQASSAAVFPSSTAYHIPPYLSSSDDWSPSLSTSRSKPNSSTNARLKPPSSSPSPSLSIAPTDSSSSLPRSRFDLIRLVSESALFNLGIAPPPKTKADADLFEHPDDEYETLAFGFVAAQAAEGSAREKLRASMEIAVGKEEAEAVEIFEAAEEVAASARAEGKEEARSAQARSLALEQESACLSMLDAVKSADWSLARERYTTLFDSQLGAQHHPIYATAAVQSLLSPELESSELKLEWFLHWYSLVPPWTDRSLDFQTSTFVAQNTRLLELLLDHPRQVTHLSRVLLLFAQKGYAGFFVERLMDHLLMYAPPESMIGLAEAVSRAAAWGVAGGEEQDGWSRARLLEMVCSKLAVYGYADAAIKAVAYVRATHQPSHVGTDGPSTVALGLETYQRIHQSLQRSLVSRSPESNRSHNAYLSACLLEDHPSLSETHLQSPILRDGLPSMFIPPSSASLPKAIRQLFSPNVDASPKHLAAILKTLYQLDPPRPRLQALIHYRTLYRHRFRAAGEDPVDVVVWNQPAAEPRWIRAEMIRMQDSAEWEEIIRLFAARFIWTGLPTSTRWGAYRMSAELSRPPSMVAAQSSGMLESEVGEGVRDIARKLVAQPGDRALVLKAMVELTRSSYDELEEVYQSFLQATAPLAASAAVPPQTSSSSPSPSSSDPYSSLPSPIAASEYNPLTSTSSSSSTIPSLPSPSPSPTDSLSLASAPPPIDPWTAPSFSYAPSPSQLDTSKQFHPFLASFAKLDPDRALAILSDMRDRGIAPLLLDWARVISGFIGARRFDEALSALERAAVEGVRDGKKVESSLYIFVIVAATRKGKGWIEFGKVLEEKMAASGVELPPMHREMMARVYVHRFHHQLHQLRFRPYNPRAPQNDVDLEFVRSPWGDPELPERSQSWYHFNPYTLASAAQRPLSFETFRPPAFAYFSADPPPTIDPSTGRIVQKATFAFASRSKWANTRKDDGSPMLTRWKMLREQQMERIAKKEGREGKAWQRMEKTREMARVAEERRMEQKRLKAELIRKFEALQCGGEEKADR
jgi:hypothetical protein